ncbi:hypothetical protein GCM10023090_20630 [Acidovorax lacteus]|uniref:Ankyrin repeat domain-containing protein n=1 Tax=Acidovorax lacteus TaxID=1924988 RepID=A0ABP8LAY8_9BURK
MAFPSGCNPKEPSAALPSLAGATPQLRLAPSAWLFGLQRIWQKQCEQALDHVNNLHWTALIESIVLGDGGPRHQATLQALLDAGASHRLTDRQGNTPLHLARQRGYADMVRRLEEAGAR